MLALARFESMTKYKTVYKNETESYMLYLTLIAICSITWKSHTKSPKGYCYISIVVRRHCHMAQ